MSPFRHFKPPNGTEGDDADEAEVRALRFTVRDGYERDLVPGDVILGCAFDEAYPE
jgi:hypothetical protein